MAKLYELTDIWESLQQELEKLSLSWEDEYSQNIYTAIIQSIADIEETIEQKCESIGILLKQMKYDIIAFESEIKTLEKRKKALYIEYEGLKQYLISNMQKLDKPIETSRISISVSNCAPSIKITNLSKFKEYAFHKGIDGFWKEQEFTENELNKTYIKECIQNGLQIPGVELVINKKLLLR